jgi:hypothetical protein
MSTREPKIALTAGEMTHVTSCVSSAWTLDCAEGSPSHLLPTMQAIADAWEGQDWTDEGESIVVLDLTNVDAEYVVHLVELYDNVGVCSDASVKEIVRRVKEAVL